jgi:HrpA-like RNA helicase
MVGIKDKQMTVGTPGLKEAKELAKKLYDDEFGAHYLLGYLWATLTQEQQQDVLESLQRYTKEKESK